MCDWPVGNRTCDHDGSHRIGALDICPMHLGRMVTGVLDAARREARQMIRDGRATPGGIEDEMRHVLAEIWHERQAARYVIQQREPCVYFAEREGYVKIGTTVNLTERMRTLTAGGHMLPGMTAGPITLLATIPGDHATEKALHRRFTWYRVDPKREWFRYEARLRKYVEGLAA